MKGLISFILLLLCFSASGQSGRVEKSDRFARIIDRLEIKYGHFNGHTGIYPLYRSDIYQYVASLDSMGLSPKDTYDRALILNQYKEMSSPIEREPVSFIKNFYRNKAHFFEYQNNKVYLAIDPILFLQAGLENGSSHQLRNTRGVEFQGQLGDRIYFRSRIFENQSTFLSYHERTIDRFLAIPGNSFYKDFNFNLNTVAYDFLNAQAYAGLKVNDFLNLEVGHGQHFIGTGIRSLIMSDYATNNFFTRANTKFWKFRYQNLFMELNPVSAEAHPGSDVLLPKKYLAQHTLSFKPTQRIEIALTETVVFNRIDDFELQYLNPIIFYRAVEQFVGSPDNVLISGQVKWNIVDGYQLYGHLMVDEFNLDIFRGEFNSWSNKLGLQLGAKAIDFLGVSQLDVQGELNLVRPYTYVHRGKLEDLQISPANFSHYSQPLAHPLGANFAEAILDIRYRAGDKWTFHPRIILAAQGVDNVFDIDSTGFNVGTNIFLPSARRAGDNNQRFLQGDRVNVSLTALNVYYEFFPNYFADFNLQYRISDSVQEEYNLNSLYFGLGVRTNFTELYRDY